MVSQRCPGPWTDKATCHLLEHDLLQGMEVWKCCVAYTKMKTSGTWWTVNYWQEHRGWYLHLRSSNLDCNLFYTQTLTYLEVNQRNGFYKINDTVFRCKELNYLGRNIDGQSTTSQESQGVPCFLTALLAV